MFVMVSKHRWRIFLPQSCLTAWVWETPDIVSPYVSPMAALVWEVSANISLDRPHKQLTDVAAIMPTKSGRRPTSYAPANAGETRRSFCPQATTRWGIVRHTPRHHQHSIPSRCHLLTEIHSANDTCPQPHEQRPDQVCINKSRRFVHLSDHWLLPVHEKSCAARSYIPLSDSFTQCTASTLWIPFFFPPSTVPIIFLLIFHHVYYLNTRQQCFPAHPGHRFSSKVQSIYWSLLLYSTHTIEHNSLLSYLSVLLVRCLVLGTQVELFQLSWVYYSFQAHIVH